MHIWLLRDAAREFFRMRVGLIEVVSSEGRLSWAKTAVALTQTKSVGDEIEQNIQCRGEVNDALLQRIYDEFLEVPGLQLTAKQAQRVWGPDESTCQQLLESLVERKFLRRNERGMYMH
jgi:Fic family protein